MTDARTIGARIRQRRDEAGLSQGQLATYARVSRSYITRLERGEYEEPAYARLERIAHALGTSVDDLTSAARADDTELVPLPRDKAPFLTRLARYSVEALANLEYIAGRVSGRVETLPGDTPAQAPAEERQQSNEQRPPPAPPIDMACGQIGV